MERLGFTSEFYYPLASDRPGKEGGVKETQLSMIEIQADALVDYMERKARSIWPDKTQGEIYSIMLEILTIARNKLEKLKGE